MYRQNLHTHTVYCDGRDTPEELIKEALCLGFDSLGFSGHSYMTWNPNGSLSPEKEPLYKKEVLALKEKYKDLIDIYLGIEVEPASLPLDLSDYEYTIGSVHYIKHEGEFLAMDRSEDFVRDLILNRFGGDGMAYAKSFYKTAATLGEYGKFDIVGHFDLVTKHAENVTFFDTESKEYQNAALEALHAVAETHKIFELNTGPVGRGYRKTSYLAPFLMKELKTLDVGLVISSDCHNKNALAAYYPEAVEYIRSFGFTEVLKLTKDGFVPMGIEKL